MVRNNMVYNNYILGNDIIGLEKFIYPIQIWVW